MKKFVVACVQNTASDDIQHNIEETGEFVRAAEASGAHDTEIDGNPLTLSIYAA